MLNTKNIELGNKTIYMLCSASRLRFSENYEKFNNKKNSNKNKAKNDSMVKPWDSFRLFLRTKTENKNKLFYLLRNNSKNNKGEFLIRRYRDLLSRFNRSSNKESSCENNSIKLMGFINKRFSSWFDRLSRSNIKDSKDNSDNKEKYHS